jgi:hypothetical protein
MTPPSVEGRKNKKVKKRITSPLVEGRENKDVRKKITSPSVEGRRNKEVREWSNEITEKREERLLNKERVVWQKFLDETTINPVEPFFTSFSAKFPAKVYI